MARDYESWTNLPPGTTRKQDGQSTMEHEFHDRQDRVWKVTYDMIDAADSLGQTTEQAENKVDQLFSTFAAEWSIYILAGATTIITALENDTTIPWLDTEYPTGSGITIRTRLINRLD